MPESERKYGGGERKPLGPAPSWDQVLQRNSIDHDCNHSLPPVRAAVQAS